MTRICSDCPSPISRHSTGRCRACAARAVCKIPGLVERRNASTKAAWNDPEMRARHKAATRAGKQRELEEHPDRLAALRQRGHEIGSRNFWRNGDLEAQAAGRIAIKRAYLAWCPESHWALNRKMKASGIPLVERKRIILDEIAGTAEHARRVVANHHDAQRIRHERDVAQAY